MCGSHQFAHAFTKAGSGGEYQLHRCVRCGHRMLLPIPSSEELTACYQGDYFTSRTDRGYDNYYSEPVRREIERVFALNLRDLGFFRLEKKLPPRRFALDIGCAAGYFVAFMQSRGWNSFGIEVSAPCVDYARKQLKLDVMLGDYLAATFPFRFDLITMWATIEHLPDPAAFLAKASTDLKPGGTLILSTCCISPLSFASRAGSAWRFYNFPEHIHYFSPSGLRRLLEQHGFRVVRSVRYGSGFGRPGSVIRRIADFIAKRLRRGDMIAIMAVKITSEAEVKQCASKRRLKGFAVQSGK